MAIIEKALVFFTNERLYGTTLKEHNMNENIYPRCPKCKSELVRSHVTDSYLMWKCENDCEYIDELQHFSDMSNESWEWVKDYFRD